MVTDVKYPLEAIGQLYRDRADCENGFDELKNQWGLSGFTTQDINRCQTTARSLCAGLQLVELVLQDGQPQRTHGGHHEPSTAVGGGGHGGQAMPGRPRCTSPPCMAKPACSNR
jgi:hypothetical protein